MKNNDQAQLDLLHHWQVCQLTPPAGIEFALGDHLGIYRLQRGNGEALTGPMFLDVAKGDQSIAKIVFEETPLAYIKHPTDQERSELLEMFKQAADELNNDERDGGIFDKDQARTRAVAFVRLRLAQIGLRNDLNK